MTQNRKGYANPQEDTDSLQASYLILIIFLSIGTDNVAAMLFFAGYVVSDLAILVSHFHSLFNGQIVQKSIQSSRVLRSFTAALENIYCINLI